MEFDDTVFNLGTCEFTDQFSDERSAKKCMEKIRWSSGRYCPHCGSACTLPTKNETPMPYRCQSCREHFSVRTGTIMSESNIPLHKWLHAIYLMTITCPGITSIQLAKEIGVTQKTAWRLKRRIELAYEAHFQAI